jgi:hypothetical protein
LERCGSNALSPQRAWLELAAFFTLTSVWALPVGVLPLLAPDWYGEHREEVMVYTEGAPTVLAVVVAAGWVPYPRFFFRLMRWRGDIILYCLLMPITSQVGDGYGRYNPPQCTRDV